MYNRSCVWFDNLDAGSYAYGTGLINVLRMLFTPVAEETTSTVTVTYWVTHGVTAELNSGCWAQLDNDTRWNDLKSGLSGPKVV